MKHWVTTACELSQFDTGSIVVRISQKHSDSYFKGYGLVKDVPTICDKIFYDELDYHEVE